ncbi:hypothetical protein, partial [Corynebacterium sp.]|uniref:hypothetical protein n=1 Tax=Corynebacterium sp. TaxID=1720 RepID=UPI0026DEA885
PPVAEGCVRVAATDMFLEGATPTYRPGDYLEHTLSLVTDPEAPALRCFIEPGTARPSGDETYWPSLAIGDGWFADVWPDAPCSGWQDIPGTLHLTGWAEQDRPVAMVVERVFAKIVHADTWFRTSDSPVLWQEIGPETDYADQDGWQAVGALLDVRPVAGGPDGDHR